MSLLGMTPCPKKHGDKYEEHPSCAIYESYQQGKVRLYCFGCGYSATVSMAEGQRLIDSGLRCNPNRKPKAYQVVTDSYFGGFTDAAQEFFKSRQIDTDVAWQYGVRMVVGEDALHLPCRTPSGISYGSQVRYLGRRRVKVKSYPLEGTTDYPHGSVVMREARFYDLDRTRVESIVIVESIADGLSIISRKELGMVVCYALLGTKLSNPSMMDIHTLSSMYQGASIDVLFDPDRAGQIGSISITNQLLSYFPSVVLVEVDEKPYDMASDKLLGLLSHPKGGV